MTSDRDDFEPPSRFISYRPISHRTLALRFPPLPGRTPRPLPEGNAVVGAIADIFDALIVTLQDTRLEPDLDDLLWSTVNLFHRATDRIDANSTTTSRRNGGAKGSRTAPR
jgi:hypothetical protein